MQSRLTLDTNSIIYAFDDKHETPVELDEVHGIIRHALGGRVNLALTTAITRDLRGDPDDDRRQKILNAVNMFPTIGAPARTDLSRFDEGDVLASANDVDVAQRIESIVFPTGIDTNSKRWKNKASDVDHLVAHRRANRDIFVTTDGPILKRGETLSTDVGIRVMSPAQALEHVERTVDVALVAEDYLERFRELTTILEEGMSRQPPHVTPDEEERYRETRSWLLRAWPKIQRHVSDYRLQQIITPAPGGQVMADRFRLAALNDDPNPFEKFYARESIEATLSRLAEQAGYRSSVQVFLAEAAEEGRTILSGLVGYLEARP